MAQAANEMVSSVNAGNRLHDHALNKQMQLRERVGCNSVSSPF